MTKRERALVLVADDDATLRRTTAELLERHGYDCVQARHGEEALSLCLSVKPDLVVLDVMMPKLDGFEVLSRLREVDSVTPVLFLSAKGDIVDKRTGFHLGADDYMVKPFLAEELLLRAEAILRRQEVLSGSREAHQAGSVTVGELTVDLRHGEVMVGGRKVDLTPKERRIMCVLAEHQGRTFTRDELIEAVWGAEYVSSSISIPVYMRNLREKLEPDPTAPVYLQTVWGQGYRLGGA
ncbi:response regulator transcription factor [uncultured Adlercreutzia sp.]|uniref:response regulator transcription factor n=1 Tax=uncultured Adlercreutzia sp. TaxID=875803 RepID=UPI0026759513|nr:response regulator transcription factor [uncultured Adlercreutzia sp.]